MKKKQKSQLTDLMAQLKEAAAITQKVFVTETPTKQQAKLSKKQMKTLSALAAHSDWEMATTTIVEGIWHTQRYECTCEASLELAMLPLLRIAAANTTPETNWKGLLEGVAPNVSTELEDILHEAMLPRSAGKVVEVKLTHFIGGDYTLPKSKTLPISEEVTVITLDTGEAAFDFSSLFLPTLPTVEVDVYQIKEMRKHIKIPIMEFNHQTPIHRNFRWKEEAEDLVMEISVDARFRPRN